MSNGGRSTGRRLQVLYGKICKPLSICCLRSQISGFASRKRVHLTCGASILADRVRAHILLCMLAYYVEWHMREAWRELMFADTEQQAKTTRDPVAPAKRSRSALIKAARHTLEDGTPVHSFATLLGELTTIVRNTCRTPGAGADAPTFNFFTTPNAKQKHALALLQKITV